jgi:hypothetical protein
MPIDVDRNTGKVHSSIKAPKLLLSTLVQNNVTSAFDLRVDVNLAICPKGLRKIRTYMACWCADSVIIDVASRNQLQCPKRARAYINDQPS